MNRKPKTEVYLTRKQYDFLAETCFKVDSQMLDAYNMAERRWDIGGVEVTTDNVQLLQCIDQTING